MIIDPDGKGLPDHRSHEGSAFLTGMILDQLYTDREPTLSALEARLCDPSQPIDDTLAQIMRAEHDPHGVMNWADARGFPTKTHPIIARAMRSMLHKSLNVVRRRAMDAGLGLRELFERRIRALGASEDVICDGSRLNA